MKSHTFRGKKYLIESNIDGLCIPPDGKTARAIYPTKGIQNTRGSLETVLHEALHACSFDTGEKVVTETAHDVARLLWRLGWRLKSSVEPKTPQDALQAPISQ